MADFQTLEKLIRHPNELARKAAIEKLGQIPDPTVLKYLLWSYKNDPSEENRQLAHTLGKRLHARLKSGSPSKKSPVSKMPGTRAGSPSYAPADVQNSGALDTLYETNVSSTQNTAALSNKTLGKFSLENNNNELFVTREEETFQPLFPREKAPEPVSSQKTKKRRVKTRDDKPATGLWGWLINDWSLDKLASLATIPMVCGFIFFVNLISFSNWIDLSYVPLESGKPFREFFIESQEAMAPRKIQFLGLYQPGINGYMVIQIFSHAAPISDGVYKQSSAFRDGLRIPVPTNYYPPTPDIITPKLHDIFLIASVVFTMAAFSIGTLNNEFYSVMRRSNGLSGFIFIYLLRFLPQLLTPKLIWFIMFVLSLGGLAFAVYFYTESAQLTVLAVNNLGLNISDAYTPTRELGLGFWLVLGSSVGGVLSTLIGLTKSPYFV